MIPTIKITRHYTLPHSREDRGNVRVETLPFEDCGEPAEDWAAEQLRDAGCTRYNHGDQYTTEEPKITDFSRGEEMTASALLINFTHSQLHAVHQQMEA